jgi:hypothetical protein
MAQRAENEGFRMLDDFVCEAIHDPSIPLANPAKQGRNEGMSVVVELVSGAPRETETAGNGSDGSKRTVSVKVTIELPEDIADEVRSLASRTQRSFDEVLVDWIRRVGCEPALELLADDEVLAVCSREPDCSEQEELGKLLQRSQEGGLVAGERQRLDE